MLSFRALKLGVGCQTKVPRRMFRCGAPPG
jgi:hypothetical protein